MNAIIGMSSVLSERELGSTERRYVQVIEEAGEKLLIIIELERATYDSVALRFIAANDHPDHDTIAAFRRRFLKEIEALFVEVLLVAREMGALKMGTVALDGAKIHANASRPSALSYEHAGNPRVEEPGGKRNGRRSGRCDGQSRGGGCGGCSRRPVDP